MLRRRLLATLAAAGSLGLAGCGSLGGGDPATPFAPPAETPVPTTERPTETETATRPTDYGADCPSLGGPVVEVRCNTTVSDPEVTALRPARDVAPLGERVGLTLRNAATAPLVTDPRRWTLHKQVNERWYYVTPLARTPLEARLASGDSLEWTLRATIGDLPAFSPLDDPAAIPGERVTLGALGGGTYAFTVQGYKADDGDTSAERLRGYSARLRFEGEALPLVPSDRVAERTRSDDAVRVELDLPTPHVSFRVRRRRASTTDPIELGPFVTEQLYRLPILRAGLAAFDPSVDTVLVRAPIDAVSFAAPSRTRTFRYRGTDYEFFARLN